MITGSLLGTVHWGGDRGGSLDVEGRVAKKTKALNFSPSSSLPLSHRLMHSFCTYAPSANIPPLLPSASFAFLLFHFRVVFAGLDPFPAAHMVKKEGARSRWQGIATYGRALPLVLPHRLFPRSVSHLARPLSMARTSRARCRAVVSLELAVQNGRDGRPEERIIGGVSF